MQFVGGRDLRGRGAVGSESDAQLWACARIVNAGDAWGARSSSTIGACSRPQAPSSATGTRRARNVHYSISARSWRSRAAASTTAASRPIDQPPAPPLNWTLRSACAGQAGMP